MGAARTVVLRVGAADRDIIATNRLPPAAGELGLVPPLLQGGTSARHGRRIGLSESPDAEHRQRNMAVVRWFTDEAIVGGWNQPTANNEHHAKARRLTSPHSCSQHWRRT